MAHELDFSTGKAAFARVTQSTPPWHGLGQEVDQNASLEVWAQQAGLDWHANRSVVEYTSGNTLHTYQDKHVLHRSDTGRPLSVVSADYKIVQPLEIIDFFKDLTTSSGFQIETMGALKEGRRIWALARVGENAKIMDDEVAPYLMLATSYDGSMATIAKFTSVRIVCNNTLQASLRSSTGKRYVTVPHSAIFNAESVRAELGIALNSWDLFKLQANRMAKRTLLPAGADEFLVELFQAVTPMKAVEPETVRKSKGYKRILDLFNGDQRGSCMDAMNFTLWGMVNAVTEYVDHEQGRSQDNRLEQAWFGTGAKLKELAFEVAEEMLT